ncbi:filamentous haemagglutinin family protein [Bradyrhizobium neotropicale]|uniref:filamentous haemagglutinin family protein n=1 Tax=Bradyrhizobium neotropicale TaxID=1497615 RepID=UPI001AD66D8F|nr:filamentous haemagglutinin family protein [Bradyrhizobium neotropicale]MBO4224090.1 filamentous hemagglutinin N-terminal domain-containing protein [Bradyrhizobium neotropicale]
MLFATVSVAALTAATPDVYARPLGGQAPTPSAAAIAAAQSAQQEAARAASQSSDALKRATLAIQAQQASQQAARDAARAAVNASSVPNGLGVGGLQRVPGAVPGTELWQGANLPTQFTDGDRVKVKIGQTQQKAILTWDTFNVGARTDLRFDQQGNRDWVALNRVLGTDARPSQILGNIKADGSVYVINQNGIIFGGGSQVNVGALIASTAKITNDQFLKGIYSTQTASTWTPSFTDAAALLGNGTGGGVVKVETGAQIQTHAPASVTSGGGFVLLMGGQVVNAGAITTPSGQTQIAAGDDFVLRPGYATDQNIASTTRGNEIAPLLRAGSLAGLVRNDGMVFSAQGDITLAGRTIEQNGILVASTSVNARGTIHLLNAATDTRGSVTLGAGSVTTVIPELESEETALNSQRDALIAASATANQQRGQSATGPFDNLSLLADRLDQSRIEIVTGGNVIFKGGASQQAGSLTIAQGGQVAVSSGGRIFTESGSTIDVSGVRNVSLAMSANNIMVNIQGNELRDSPQNRDNGALKNADVWVDIRDLTYVPDGTGGHAGDRYYTPGGLLEVGGYLANTKHTIGEWSAVGGTITLSAPEVIAQAGSVFDISGGSIRYEAGYIRTTNFLGSDGRLYNINDARADMTFYGLGSGFIREHERWNVTEVWTSPFGKGRESVRWEEGYTVGRDAGKLILSTPTAIFEGNILADIVEGERQSSARPDGADDGYKLAQNVVAQAGTLAIGQYRALGRIGAYNSDVVIGDMAAMSIPADRTNTIWFDAGYLNAQGLGGIDFATSGKITIDAPLSVVDGGSVSLIAGSIDVKAGITAHSGHITATNHFVSAQESAPRALGPGTITLATGVTLDARGLWVNSLDDAASYGKRAFIDGGDVSLVSQGDVIVPAGSMIDVSAGGGLFARGEFIGGRGGNVALKTEAITTGLPAGRLTLDGTIRGFGVSGGGTLAIASGGTIVFGGEILKTNGVLGAGEKARTDLLVLDGFDILAGDLLPADFSYTSTRAAPGQTIGVAPNFSAANPVTLAADWTPPPPPSSQGAGAYSLTVDGSAVTVTSSSVPTIRAGSVITGITSGFNFPREYVIPASVFPTGIPTPPTTVTASAGSPAPFNVRFNPGTVIRSGSTLQTSVAVRPLEYLQQNLLQSGFSRYDVAAGQGLVVAPGTQLDVTVPVYRFASASFAVPTGADPKAALEIWLPPQYLDNPAKAQLTQRAGADLSLTSVGGITLARGSAIEVDDGRSVTLNALGQVTIEGSITARSGNVTIASNIANATQLPVPGQSIWIGSDAALDVSARPVVGTDAQGRRYGIIRDGGAINIGMTSFSPVSKDALPATFSLVIIRPGALLEASGTGGVVDLIEGMNTAPRPVAAASNGGSILIGSQGGLYLDGEMRAEAGGTGAAGGRLTLVLETPSGYSPITAAGPRIFTITQDRQTGSLAPSLTPGFMDQSLRYGKAYISSTQVTQGGFDNLSLWSRDVFEFKGDVNLSTGQSLSLYRGFLSTTLDAPSPHVALSAPHVLLDGAVEVDSSGSLSAYPGLVLPVPRAAITNRGTLTVTADLIDVRNRVFSGASAIYQTGTAVQVPQGYAVQAPGFAETELVSRGDVRFGTGALVSGGNIMIEAAQIYPTTGAVAQIVAGLNGSSNGLKPDGLLTIRGNGTIPALPESVFGTLSLMAGTIEQRGTVRAPLGSVLVGSRTEANYIKYANPADSIVFLREGSITSTSAAGLVIPYGGTTDGLSYRYADAAVTFDDLTSTLPPGRSAVGVTLSGSRVVAERGAVLDLTGGGDLTGAGFISGRGGSVDVLETPLVNANPAFSYSDASNRVYALMPGYASSYAPMSPEKGAGDPLVGQQITLTQPAGRLPAGTYTLLPSTYALLPGAYRIELGNTTTVASGPVALATGSYITTGIVGVANTGIRSALPSRVILTPGSTVRSYSHYNEMSYGEFALANAAKFGLLRPRLPVDAQTLVLNFGSAGGDVLSFDGTALMEAEKGGYASNLVVYSEGALEIKPSGTLGTSGMASIDAEELSRFHAGTLLIGGFYSYRSGQGDLNATSAHIYFTAQSSDVVVRGGSVLEAGQIFAVAGNSVHAEGGAVFDTTQSSASIFDSSAGYFFSNSFNGSLSSAGAIVAVSNGWLNFLPAATGSRGAVTIDDGTAFRTLGTIAFSASRALDLGANVALNGRYVTVSLPEINVGTDASLAAARDAGTLGAGWMLTQSVLDRLLAPTDPALPHPERLTLTVGSSLNFFGDVALDMRSANGGNNMLVLNTPAIYGLGATDDVAALSADTVIWNGVSSGVGTVSNPYVSLAPGAVRPGGPGTGAGTLTINAREIIFGYDPFARPQNEATLDRLALGFTTVNVAASDRITANNRGALAVYRSGTDASTYAGGDLNITTPLLTAEAGGFLSVTAGGAIAARAGTGGPADTARISQFGGELRLKGGAITIDTAIALPSGRLELKAAGDITLTGRAALDLSARSVTFFDVTKYSWGGDVVMESAGGTIAQQAGSIIDVSAAHNDAGSIRAAAVGAGGTVAFHGTLRGAGGDGFESGGFDLRAFTLADFAGLNGKLTDGRFFGARSFVLKTGNLEIGNEVRAREVNISVDGGSLTVNGRIDASGARPGSIRLASRDDLTLASTAILDARSTVLQVDSTGAPIEASNRGHVELTSAQGTIRLATGATIDLRSADHVARGRIEINASRRGGVDGTGAGADDIAIDAAGPLDIRGAASIAVNGFRRYEPASRIINQSLLDTIHSDSTAFIDAALANSALQGRLAGLTAYGNAFHLRPGVEIWSSGDLATEGDLDLSGYRYGPHADPSVRGSGEPGALVIRAAGNLPINGSINDGFAPPAPTPDDGRWANRPREVEEVIVLRYVAELTVHPSANITLAEDWGIPTDFGYDLIFTTDGNVWFPGDVIPSGSIIDVTGADIVPFFWYAGMTVPAIVTEKVAPQGQMWAIAPMLPGGSLSWSMRYVAGADLAASDSRSTGRFGGDIVLNDLHFTGPSGDLPAISVVRTGTGYLDLLAGGSYRQESLFGVYTAGTATGHLARERSSDGTVLGPGYSNYEAALNPIGIYFTEHGGDVLLAAGGDVAGFSAWRAAGGRSEVTSDVAGWSWTQDGKWGINFGTYDADSLLFLRGFAGIGTLGGGNVVIRAGGDAKNDITTATESGTTTALAAAVGGSGYTDANGSRLRSGGGKLTVDIAGWVNPGISDVGFVFPSTITNLRGNIDVRAASVGRVIEVGFGVLHAGDPRPSDPLVPNTFLEGGRQNFSLGDGRLTVKSRSDIVATVSAAGNLWTDTTAAELFSAGGDVSPSATVPSLSTIAAHGTIYTGITADGFNLMPSPVGQLELLAWNSINGYNRSGGTSYIRMSAGTPIGNLHIDDPDPVRIYAMTGDIVDVVLGMTPRDFGSDASTYDPIGKYLWMRAGRDIFKSGFTVLNNRETDVSIVSAGRDIIFAQMYDHNYQIAGPGTLEVTAGRNIYQAEKEAVGPFVSIGSLVAGDLRLGADIVVQAGVGPTGPAYAALATRYLNPINLAQSGVPLADQPGKVAKTYETELSAWLKGRFGFDGTIQQAITYFDALPTEQRNIFLREVYFAELRAGGREYNDPASSRFNSYLRGREAIATLFPDAGANGNPIERKGDITIFGGAHIRTNFGGNIQMLAPNGQIIVGLEGEVPPSSAGIITQGAGDIQMYSKGSVLLGLSRIMTTFGGDILIWSAEGDINAGRGAKSTIVYTPAKRVYDNYGGVALSPNVPSSGAGIATLNPIPGVAAGNVDLIAPLGTIDAGEAGIRSSGNVNLAALQILNAANIQAQGNTTGVPTIQAPNIGGLTEASNTAGAAQQVAKPAQTGTAEQPSIIIVEFLGFGGGDSETPQPDLQNSDDRRKRSQLPDYDPNGAFRAVGNGRLTEEQRSSLTERERRNLDKLVDRTDAR